MESLVALQISPVPDQDERYVTPNGMAITLDNSRDDLLTDFGRSTLRERYLLPGETIQQAFARCASAFADNATHAQRMYNYMSMLWFMPATPILSNGGAGRGMPISCFLSSTEDSLEGIVSLWTENVWLASNGGGIGNYWGNLRSIGEKVGRAGATSGIIPFIAVQDRMTLAISQGSLRRGSAAVYLDVGHPEIEEFLHLRKPTGGDQNRKGLNLHHGILIPDAFMEAVKKGTTWDLTSPKTHEVIRTVDARTLFAQILELRLTTGEPYLIFIDAVNREIPEHHKQLGLKVLQSNLCSEITLPTGRDHLGNDRTAVCCLSSINMERQDEYWDQMEPMVEDIMRFLDNVLTWFIDNAPDTIHKAKYSAMRERSVGLGIMGFHGWLQKKNIPFESAMAKGQNLRFFTKFKECVDTADEALAKERGPCPDAAEVGVMKRFSCKTAIAPTASISTIANATAAGEPAFANFFTQKTLDGAFFVKNPYLEKLLADKGKDTQEVWTSISVHKGSVQHLDFLSDWEKDVFKTAIELDQRWIIDHSADRTPFIDQAQSVNLFMAPDCDKTDLLGLHVRAFDKGMKSLYYLRSESIVGDIGVSKKVERVRLDEIEEPKKYDECLACQ